MESFEDHFSKQARQYAEYRPHYPDELFEYLANCSPDTQLAWDCGTGNGQAAHGLAGHFVQVIATDASPDQIAQAEPHDRIEYRIEQAGNVSLESSSVDLITSALAVHWFDHKRFYQEVNRVGKPGAILAVWTYHLPQIEPSIDHVLAFYYADVLSGYWPERIHYIEEHYRTLPFPFEELSTPTFRMDAEWDLRHLTGFLESWSATQRYQADHEQHPIRLIWNELAKSWGDPTQRRTITWPLYLRVGRIS